MDKLYNSRLRKFRKQLTKRNTQLDFSEVIGVTPEFYSAVETGKKSPSISLHIDICSKLNKPSDCFFKEKKQDSLLTKEQLNHLNSLDTEQLSTMLGFLQTIYENNK